MSSRQRQANLTAVFCGLAATAIVLILYLAGWLNWIELKTLDLRFLHAGGQPEDGCITCVDIDDTSIETVGRWPWPRDVQAGLISILAELEPAALLLDITLTESELVRPVLPRHADMTCDPRDLRTDGVAFAFPDLELETAIKAAGMVYLAFDYTPTATAGPSKLVDAAQGWLNAQPARWQQRAPALFEPFCAALAKDPDIDVNRQSDEIALALRYALGYEPTTRPELLPARRAAAVAQPVGDVSPVYYLHARAAKRCGFVVFEPDTDGVMRRMRLLVRHEGRVLPQLAFAVACDALGLEADNIIAAPGGLLLRVPGWDRPLVVQLDGDGRTLVPWVPERDWTQQFGRHVPMDAVWQVYDRQCSIRHNRELVLARLGGLLDAGLLADQRQHFDDLRQALRLESDLLWARYADDADAVADIEGWLAEYHRILPEGSAILRTAVARLADQLESEADNDAAARAHLPALHEIEHALTANEEHAAEIKSTLQRLRPRVAGKLCLIGYTATSLADMTPIATNKRAPGVVAHANLLNGLLTGHMAYWAPVWLNSLIAAALGALAALISVGWRPRAAATLLAAIAVAFVALAGWLAFARWTYWIALTPAVLAPAAAYFAVLLYRYIFLERESRQIATALSQYTSATLARQMAENAELCRRAETREVTAVFTDLRGFTTISERIGAERTQRVLNACLGRCSEVMLQYEAMINKFLGDGIFAFWNPVIYPQPDHAWRACETAIDLLAAMQDLAADQRRSGGDEAFADLFLRVGVASGNAVVGPCGSEQKYDYTCIGDTVNVAARLESANKFYGTRVLVSGGTRDAVAERFEFRPLGGVQVKGRHEPVPIYELLGRAGQVPDEVCQYARDFEQAVALFQHRDWPAARAAFEVCRRRQPDDRAAAQYAQAAATFVQAPPPDDWKGAIELAEK